MSDLIPVNEPDIGERELELVTDCVKSGWISSAGTYIERFETEWAARCDRAHGVAVSNGTVALQLAVASLDLKPGGEIIMPSFTIISCALAAIYGDLRPVFVDADPETWCMDVEQVGARISDRTVAIMPVHIYGHPVDMDPVLALAEKHGLRVIEDAAEAHGAQYLRSDGNRVPAGGMGDVSTFSFYANKLVTTGEGGMLLTDDAKLAARARFLRNLAFGRESRFAHDSLGFNFRMTNLQAALGVAQLERFEQIVEKKRQMASRYIDLLSERPELQLPVERAWATNVYWMFGLVLSDDFENDAGWLASQLRKRGIETRPFFLGMHEQPILRRLGLVPSSGFPVTERLSRRGLYLPSGLGLSEAHLDQVALAVKDVLR